MCNPFIRPYIFLLASLPTSDNVFMAFETLIYIDAWLDIEMSYIKRSCIIPMF